MRFPHIGAAMSSLYRGLEALRAFVETGSVSNAALRLRRTQPQISRTLAQLEEEIGFTLFLRNTRPPTLTREGRRFYEEAEGVVQGMDKLRYLAKQMREKETKHLRILTTPFITNAVVTDAVADLTFSGQLDSAQIESRLHLGIESWMSTEIFDLGVIVAAPAHPSFETRTFLTVEPMAIVPKDNPLAQKAEISFDDFADQSIIQLHSRSMLRQHLARLSAERGVELSSPFQAANGLIACQLVDRGLGCCLADPFVSTASGLANIAIRRFTPALKLEYSFMYPLWQSRSQLVEIMSEKIETLACQKWQELIQNADR